MTMPEGDLDALISAAKEHPPVPPVGAVGEGWSRLRGSLGAAVVLPQIDVPPGLVESAIAGKTVAGTAATVAGWSWMGKAIASAVVTVTVGGIGVAASGVGERKTSPVSQGVATSAASQNAAPAPTVAEPPAIATPAELPAPTEVPVVVAIAAEDPAPIAKRTAPKPEEAPMIAAAMKSLNGGDAAGALRELARHAKIHPRGDMREEREALRVIALCKAGRTADAASARTKFLDEYPSSPHASRVKTSCST